MKAADYEEEDKEDAEAVDEDGDYGGTDDREAEDDEEQRFPNMATDGSSKRRRNQSKRKT